jgi:hypothetical protein
MPPLTRPDAGRRYEDFVPLENENSVLPVSSVLHPLRFPAKVQQDVMLLERLDRHRPGLCFEVLQSQEFRR